MTDFAALLRTLLDGGVAFVLVGGVAATVHGSSRLTRDVDILYDRNRHNIDALVRSLAPFHPYLRGAPRGLPFTFDAATATAGLNFTLVTDIGDLDLLGELVGVGSYTAVRNGAMDIEIFGLRCRCLSLEQLLAAKRAAGRPKDLEAVAELELIRDTLNRTAE